MAVVTFERHAQVGAGQRDQKLGVVLIAHGSRVAEANAELQVVAAGLRERGFGNVVPAYLELAEPDIVTGGRQCVEAGAEVVVLSPYFLSAGRHVCTDLEAARARLATLFPQCQFRLAAPLGPHHFLNTILDERIQDCMIDADVQLPWQWTNRIDAKGEL